jgi:hypothetical protein
VVGAAKGYFGFMIFGLVLFYEISMWAVWIFYLNKVQINI